MFKNMNICFFQEGIKFIFKFYGIKRRNQYKLLKTLNDKDFNKRIGKAKNTSTSYLINKGKISINK